MKLLSTSTVCLLFSALFYRNAWAQATSPASEVREAQIAQLQAWGEAKQITALSPLNLDVRVADLQAARATEPLQNWVRNGGIIILHTDAAQAFGFSVIQARERTFNRAGQLWGRGANALPFGGSPLLLGGRSQSRRGLTDGIPGVRTVFYQLQSGDAVLGASGAAVIPLLRVEDNTLPETNKNDPTFYAAAMRRYGKGWALFLPRTIEARADGAQFQQNVDAFIRGAGQSQWLTLSVAVIQAAYKPASHQQNVAWSELRELLFPTADSKTLPVVSDDAQLILSSDDAKTVDSALQQVEAAPKDDNLQTSGRALVYLLAARALWQLDSDNGTPSADAKLAALWDISTAARETLWQAQSDGPAASMTRWWNGVFALGAALPPIPTSYETELIAFSYARPALEAAQWWQGIKSKDENLVKLVGLAGVAAQKMAQQHNDDPPLLSYWKTDSGTRYYMQLFPIQAASDKFPPLPQEWGVPRRSNTFQDSNLSTWLVPIGSDNAMAINTVPQLLTFPKANSIRPQMFWLCSPVWSDEIPHNWGLLPRGNNISLFPYDTHIESSPSGATYEQANQFYFSYLQNERIRLRYPALRPLPSWPAYLKQIRIRPGADKNTDENDDIVDSPRAIYQRAIDEGWNLLETNIGVTPVRVARLQAHLMSVFWFDNNSVPKWIDDGLQNNFSLDMVDIIKNDNSGLRKITPFPPDEILLKQNPRSTIAQTMINLSLRQSLYTENAEVEPFDNGENEGTGELLSKLDSTNQITYFYKRFGAGAFVGTLQRLGSGQSIDAAMLATTGLNQQHFFAAANAN